MWRGFVNTGINPTPKQEGRGLTELKQYFD
jgi:hypothetical protein